MSRLKQISKTNGGKVLIAIWVLIITVLIGFAVFGFYKKELLGYIATSVFPSGILLIISILIAYNVKNDSLKIAKTGWVVLSIAVLIFALMVGVPQHPKAYGETGMIIGYSMSTLSFPACFLIAYLYFGLAHLFDYLGASNFLSSGKMNFYLTNFILWLGFFIVGYLQWFKLLPFLIGKWQSRRSHASPT